MPKLSTPSVAGGYATVDAVNANFDAVDAAIENTLSRDGTSPNAMAAPLDMNSNRIINLPAPVAGSDAARLTDVQAALSGTPTAAMVPFTPVSTIAANNVQAALAEVASDLAAVSAGQGASLVGIQDVGNYFAGTTVEAALQALGAGGTSVTAANVSWTQAGTGAVLRNVDAKFKGQVVDVTDFGVTLDGLNGAANLVAFQAAITYCQDNLKTLRIPSNQPSQVLMLAGGTLNITKPLCLIGDGQRNITIANTTLGAGQFIINVDGTTFGTFEQGEIGGFTLLGTAGAHCMQIKNVSNSRFFDIGVRNCTNGIVYTGATRCFSNVFERLLSITAITGSAFKMEGHGGGGHHSFRECGFTGSTCFSIDSATVTDNISFYQCNFEQGIVNSFFIGGSCAGLSFFGCRTEGCDSTDFQINPAAGKFVRGLVVHGTTFNSSDSGGITRISLGGAGGPVRGFDISGNTVEHGANNYSASFVTLNGDGESGSIHGNFLNGTLAGCSVTNVRRSNVAIYNNEANNGKFSGLSGSLVSEHGTLTLTDASGAGLGTLGTGTYTRIGRVVTWQGLVTYPVTANAAGALFTGLPYCNAEVSDQRGGNYLSGTDSVALYVLRLGANFRLDKTAFANCTNAEMSGKSVYLGGQFFTTSA